MDFSSGDSGESNRSPLKPCEEAVSGECPMAKCDKCDKDATVHMTEIDHKTKEIKQIHLCDDHAIERLGMRPAPVARLFVERHFSQLERWSSLVGLIALGYMTSFIVRAKFAVVDAIGFVIALSALLIMAGFRVYLGWLSSRTHA
jgi:hypothetical protein